MRLFPFLLILAALTLGGCYSKPIRHLGSDAALIKAGESTQKDVQKYLGEPNGRREVSPGVSEYVYYEDQPGMFGHTPVLEKLSGPSGYEMIVITINHGLVSSIEFRNHNESDRAWMDNYTWEEVK